MRPIAQKYREGKMQRTLERELKVSEIAKGEAIAANIFLVQNDFLLSFFASLSLKKFYTEVKSKR